MIVQELQYPIVQAPMAGGPSTPELAAAVSEAGGLGFVAAGYRKADDLRAEIAAVRQATSRPFGVNLFVPSDDTIDEEVVRGYVERLGPLAGRPRWDDDDWQAKLALLREEPVPIVSFTFGCPPHDLVHELRGAGSEVWVTVSSAAEAHEAGHAGAQALIVQGVEAGGHQGTWQDGDDVERLGLLALLRLVAAVTDLPLIAAGGIADGAAVGAVLVAGAAAAQIGTALMLAHEAGTHPAHRAALAGDGATALTRAFTGRTARGIVNRFMVEHRDAPPGYPHVHYATAPMRAEARQRDDPDGFNLWAGQAHKLAQEGPAAEIVRRLAEDARAAVRKAAERLGDHNVPEQPL